jgi:molybdenum cofactor cytidylyltransferase
MTDLLDLDLGIKQPTADSDLKVAAVVLAAGRSSRMGERMKLLLDIDGMPMIRRTVGNVIAIDPVETVVVTGHRAEEVEAALDRLPIRIVRNPRHAEGQPTSAAAGVRALTRHCNAVMVVLGDQPLVGPDELRALVAAYRQLDGGSILVPHHNGQRGNPIIFAARHIPSIVSGGLNVGCRKLIDTHPDEVAKVEFASEAFTLDCDTPEDYEELIARLGRRPWPA